MARMPSCDAGARMFMMPASVNIDASAVERKKMRDEDEARGGAEFRPAHDAGGQGGRLQAFVRRAPASTADEPQIHGCVGSSPP